MRISEIAGPRGVGTAAMGSHEQLYTGDKAGFAVRQRCYYAQLWMKVRMGV
jgi:hypothetical protein